LKWIKWSRRIDLCHLNVSLRTQTHKNETYVIKMAFKMVSKRAAGNSHYIYKIKNYYTFY